MYQLTFSEAEYTHKKRKTRREKFLEQIDELIPWKELERKIGRYYPKPGKGRRPYPLSVMLRVHCMQLFYNLSDPAMEDALYEIESMRRFAGLRLSGALPDETTILNFRHLLEKHNLGKAILQEVNRYLERKGLLLREGTIVDATILSAPTSTKNQSGKRDPEMHRDQERDDSLVTAKSDIAAWQKTPIACRYWRRLPTCLFAKKCYRHRAVASGFRQLAKSRVKNPMIWVVVSRKLA